MDNDSTESRRRRRFVFGQWITISQYGPACPGASKGTPATQNASRKSSDGGGAKIRKFGGDKI